MNLQFLFAVLPLAVLCGGAFAHAAPQAEQRVRLVVQIPEKHAGAALYLASNLNDWNPSDPKFRLSPESGENPTEYHIELPLSALPGGGLEFKFTKGAWDTVELDAEKRDIANRTLSPASFPRGDRGGIAEFTFAVAAFADEREDAARPSTVVGELEMFEFTSGVLENTRTVRVWLPEAYESGEGDFPVLYMHDGQNCFDEATSAFGDEWRIDETLTELIAAGEIEPMIVVGIDNAGLARAAEYNASYTRFRGVVPYGEKYVAMLVDELIPEIERRYRVRTGPENTSLGGSSFGGNVTMLAAMERPGVFGRLLIESPAVPVVGTRFLDSIKEHGDSERWTPDAGGFVGGVFVAMGTKETGNEAYNQQLVELMEQLRPVFARERHRFVVEEGAIHNERAWAKRFPDAARFLFGPVETED